MWYYPSWILSIYLQNYLFLALTYFNVSRNFLRNASIWVFCLNYVIYFILLSIWRKSYWLNFWNNFWLYLFNLLGFNLILLNNSRKTLLNNRCNLDFNGLNTWDYLRWNRLSYLSSLRRNLRSSRNLNELIILAVRLIFLGIHPTLANRINTICIYNCDIYWVYNRNLDRNDFWRYIVRVLKYLYDFRA